MNQSHIEFVRNSCLVISGFEPVKFFAHFQFKASARAFATNVLKETVEVLKEDNDEKVKEWARRFAAYDYQVLETTFIDDYWLSVSSMSNETLKRTFKEQQVQYRWESFTKDNYEGAQKKRKTRHNNDQQEVLKTMRKVDLQLLDDVSEDKVVVEWTDESLGNVLRKYTKKYINNQSNQLSVQDSEGLVLLAQNNILNLIDRSNKGQKKIFHKEQWSNLKEKWPVETEEFHVNKKMMKTIKVSKAAGRNIDNGLDEARTMYKQVSMIGDERNFYCFTHKIFEVLERHPELFDHEKKKEPTENDYVVRLWAPLLFALFDDCRNLKLTWGESVLRGVGDESYYKVDLRVSFNAGKESYVLSTAEFAKNSNLSKLRTDHVKLLLEGNALISNIKKHNLQPELSLLQCAGNEVDILSMKAIDSHFTIAKRPTQALRISNNFTPEKLISVYSCFLQYKRITIDFMNLIVAATDNAQINNFDKAWGSNPSSQASTH